MRVNYKGKFMYQLGDWRRSDIAVRDAILEWVEAAADDPFHGIGDPHLVKELGRGTSRIIIFSSTSSNAEP